MGKTGSSDDLRYSLGFLKKLNALSYKGRPLSHQKIFGKYNVWIFFQTRLLFNDLREFARERRMPKARKLPFSIFCQNFLLSGLGLLSFCAGLGAALLFPKKILVYSIDRTNSDVFCNDARMDFVYEYLKASRMPFLEFLHTNYDKSFLKRFLKRQRLPFYVKAIDTIFNLACFLGVAKRGGMDTTNLDLSDFGSAEEKKYARFLVEKYLSEVNLVIFKIKILRKVLSWLRPQMLLAIDNTRDYWELLLACKLEGIKTYTFQHGHFTKYHAGWLNDGSFSGEIVSPDKFFVWSNFWKEELIRLGTYFPKDSIEVGGMKSIIPWTCPKSDHDYTGVLLPYEVGRSRKEARKNIDNLLSCRGVRILFKLRTDLDFDKQMEDYGIHKNYHKNLKFVSSVTECLAEVDIVVGTYSTFLYDMIAYERPIAILNTNSDFGEGLLLHNLADPLGDDNLCGRLREIESIDTNLLKERKEKLFGKNPGLMRDKVWELGKSLS